jgi:hypothetical protein
MSFAIAPSAPQAPEFLPRAGHAARAAWLACALSAAVGAQAQAQPAPRTERLTIADPFIELHTGPGRGYPVFFVVQRGDAIEVTLRRTDWFRVRTPDGKEGWVHRRQLETTLTEAGGTRTFRDVLVDDYLARRVELGTSWGRFESDPMLKIWGLYRLSDTLRGEATVGQVQGTFSGSSFWHLNLLAEPWSDRRLSPTASLGFGNFRNVPNLSLVNTAVTNARLSNASIGVRWYLSDRFVARADYTLYTAFVADNRSAEYRAITGGLSFFF